PAWTARLHPPQRRLAGPGRRPEAARGPRLVGGGGHCEALGVKSKAFAQLRRVEAKVGRVVGVPTVLFAWRIRPPGGHPCSSFIREFLAEKGVELLQHWERVFLEW